MLSVRAVRDGGLHLSILELPPAFPRYSGRALVGSPGVSLGVLSGVFGPWAGYPRVVPPKFPQGSLKPWSPGVPRPKQTRNRNMKLSPEQTTNKPPSRAPGCPLSPPPTPKRFYLRRAFSLGKFSPLVMYGSRSATQTSAQMAPNNSSADSAPDSPKTAY